MLDLKKKALREFRQKRMGFIFKDYNLLDTLTVKENIIPTITGKSFFSMVSETLI